VTHTDEGVIEPGPEPSSVGDPAMPPPTEAPQGVRSKRRLTPKQLALTFVAVLAGTVGGTLIANSLGHGDNSGGMSQWMDHYGANYLAVSHDVARVNAGTSSAAIRGACVRLASDVQTAQTNPPMPIGSLETPWSLVLHDLRQGAHSCVVGIDQNSTGSVNQAVRDFNEAGTRYLQLVKAVDAANP
jgi:hypothetical protein